MKNSDEIEFNIQPLSEDATKLANILYNTYIKENDAQLHISVLKLCDVFNYDCDDMSKSMIMKLFDELNEPVMIPHFKYHGQTREWERLSFCYFDEVWKFEDDFIEISIDEMFLYLLKHYVDAPFINIV